MVQEHLEEVVQQHLEEQHPEELIVMTPSPPQRRRPGRLRIRQWWSQAKQWVQPIPRQDPLHLQRSAPEGPSSNKRLGRDWPQ